MVIALFRDFNEVFLSGSIFKIGGFLGSKIAVKIDQVLLKKIFAIVLVIAAFKLFFSK